MNRFRRAWRAWPLAAGFALLITVYFIRPAISSSTRPALREIGGLHFVQVPGGRLRMGSPEGPAPQPVEVAPFLLARFELTQKAFAAFDPMHPSDPRLPASGIDYHQAQAFCAWFSTQHDVRARLPSEAEWEWAARGGQAGTRYPWGWGAPEGRARFDADGPAPVGSHAPNRYGLHDLAGNLFEWCAAGSDAEQAPARGGSWAERNPDLLRVYHTVPFPLDYRDADLGMRVLIEPATGAGPSRN